MTTSKKKSIVKPIVKIIVAVAAFIGFIVFLASTYTLQEKHTAIVLNLGKIDTVNSDPGFHFKAPFVSSVYKVYTGDNMYDMPVSDVITSDKKSMIADDFVVWQVTDATLYYRTLGAVKERAEERIEAAVYNATKNTISSMTQEEIIASRGDVLTNLITTASNSDIAQYGVVIKTATIKALDLPDNNKQAIYNRMISERQNIAEGYRAQGQADAKLVYNETDKKTKVILADAKAKATVLEAEGEAEYMRILSDAYNDPNKAEFYAYLRGLDALRALANKDNTIILDKDSPYAKILYGGA